MPERGLRTDTSQCIESAKNRMRSAAYFGPFTACAASALGRLLRHALHLPCLRRGYEPAPALKRPARIRAGGPGMGAPAKAPKNEKMACAGPSCGSGDRVPRWSHRACRRLPDGGARRAGTCLPWIRGCDASGAPRDRGAPAVREGRAVGLPLGRAPRWTAAIPGVRPVRPVPGYGTRHPAAVQSRQPPALAPGGLPQSGGTVLGRAASLEGNYADGEARRWKGNLILN